MPTILSITGVDTPKDLDGENLLELISSPNQNRALYGQSGKDYFAWIEGDYKYHFTSLGGTELLFNVKEDPYETKNLANIPEHKDILIAFRNNTKENIFRYNPKMDQNGLDFILLQCLPMFFTD